MKISRRRLADYLEKLQQKACGTCSTFIFPHSTNHIIDLSGIAVDIVISQTPYKLCFDVIQMIFSILHMAEKLERLISIGIYMISSAIWNK